MYKRILIGLMIMSAILAGCTPAKTGMAKSLDMSLLHGDYSKVWELTEYSNNGIMTAAPAWAADNVLLFNNNGTAAWVYGEVDKDTNDTVKYDAFTWQAYGNHFVTRGHGSTGWNHYTSIISLTGDELVTERVLPADGDRPAEILRLVYRASVKPQAKFVTSGNQLLTHGLAKLWGVVETSHDGTPVEIPSSQLDDYLLFFADGTGYCLLGETEAVPGDTRNNDHVKWSIEDNGTKLRISEYDGEYTNLKESKVLRLEENLLVLEGYRMINAKNTLVTVTYMPMIAITK